MNIETIQKALNFAANAHHGQKIPASDLPYLLHVTQVYTELLPLLSLEPNLHHEQMLLCALLHDTIEDTEATFAQVEKEFGENVAKGVQALSKNPDLPKAVRMEDSLARIVKQGKEVRIVKMADRIVNLKAPPYYWDTAKRQRYRQEAQLILEKLGGGICHYIEQRLAEKIEDYGQYIESD